MAKLNISVGISDFSEIRQNQYYYVDKSGLIRQLTDGNQGKSYIDHPSKTFWKNTWNEHAGKFF